MKKITLLFLMFTILRAQDKIELKIDSLLSQMTLEEKAGQLVQYSGSFDTGTKTQKPREGDEELLRQGKIGSFLNLIGAKEIKRVQKISVEESRLGIPLLFGLDVIHGFKTTFPVPLAQAGTWNPELVELSTRWQAIEASSAGINWTFSPMIDIARDPRWGRIVEGSGEDPYLGAIMAAASVRGYQGNNISDKNTLAACAKHFAGYGAAEGGKDYNTVDISERTLREIHLRPFKAAVDAGVSTLMASFNEIGGIPTSANPLLMNDILRGEWGFDGFVISDWNTVGELVVHGISEDLKKATALSINSGLDMDMCSNGYHYYLPELVREGKVSEKVLDESVKRVLRIKLRLGLFDDPYKYCDTKREEEVIRCKEIVNASLEVARESIVLLKNKNNLLPLNREIRKIGIIGPLADSRIDPLGPWHQQGKEENAVSVVQGIINLLGENVQVNFDKGCETNKIDDEGFENAIAAAENSDVVVLCLGESLWWSGEASSRVSLDLPGEQEELAKTIVNTGKPVIVVLMNGRPLTINWLSENVDAIVEAWYLGEQSGNAIAETLFGDVNPSGKLTVSFPRAVGQVPVYYNYKSTGRPMVEGQHFTSHYLDIENTPLYPFGYGLSYTTFEYSNLRLNTNEIRIDEFLQVSVDVKNTGSYAGKEVAQLYIRDLFGSVTRPVKELKGFEKIYLEPGETKTVTFTITPEELKFWDVNMNYVVEPGDFKIFVGTNSVDVLEESFRVIE